MYGKKPTDKARAPKKVGLMRLMQARDQLDDGTSERDVASGSESDPKQRWRDLELASVAVEEEIVRLVEEHPELAEEMTRINQKYLDENFRQGN